MPKEMSELKNLNSERAKLAFDELNKIKMDSLTDGSKLRTLARNFPTMVQTNGLTAAVTYLYAKKRDEKSKSKEPKDNQPNGDNVEVSQDTGVHDCMYNIIFKRLTDAKIIRTDKDMMKSIVEMDSDELRLATAEVMAFLVWVKRFAEGMFEANEKRPEKK